jgi:lipoprotein NlpI
MIRATKGRRVGFFPSTMLALLATAAGFALSAGPGDGDAQRLIEQAERAYRAGDAAGALEMAGKAIEKEPQEPRWRNYRGAMHFRLARIEESITDFDQAIQLSPRSEPHHWQRGISYYYAGQYEKGARQFEIHRTVNPQDVENAVWHFLCVVRWKSLDEARRQYIPIENDSRVPMMEIHALFAGRARAEDVLRAAQAGDPPPRELHQRLFYAHLYLGLYYEVLDDATRSAHHIELAVEKYPADHYMGDVARVHRKLREARAQP